VIRTAEMGMENVQKNLAKMIVIHAVVVVVVTVVVVAARVADVAMPISSHGCR